MKTVWHAKNKGVGKHPLVNWHAKNSGVDLRIGGPLPVTASKKNTKQSTQSIDVERIGWGFKSSGLWAKQAASFRLFEDGFVRSLRPGYNGGAIYSLVEDKKGIYYDGNGDSDLIDRLNHGDSEGHDERTSVESTMERFINVGASKYNWFPAEHAGTPIEQIMPNKGILVIDQTAGDAAIRFGKGSEEVFTQMLHDALDLAGDSPVYVRTHPDAYFRKRKSCFPAELLRDKRIIITPSAYPPNIVFPHVSQVFVFNSLLGMEALVHGCQVRVYGCPFYSGWGLTDDCHPEQPARERELGLTELFDTAYQKYSFYFDPNTGNRCSLDRILDHLALQKEAHARNANPKLLFGFSGWKSKAVSRFLVSPGMECDSTKSLKVVKKWQEENQHGKIHAWSVKGDQVLSSAPLVRIEDGFLRSVGLGADFHTPISLVLDLQGMYFDSTRGCDLETILNETDFSESDLEVARLLIVFLVENRVTKYNLKTDATAAWGSKGGRKVLVPGQVESDASLRYGQSPFLSNLAFLMEVRRNNPAATIAYKPHPDVVKKLRPGSAVLDEMNDVCDVLIQDLDITPWLDSCDEVHTLTSQAGFEALLRGRDVTCYGVPFYSGWGLTTDKQSCERRSRKLSLEELVAGVLVHYPIYLNPKTSEFMTALDASKLLADQGMEETFSRSLFFRVFTAVKRIIHPLR